MEEIRRAELRGKEIRYINKDGRNWYAVTDLDNKMALSEYCFRYYLGDEILRAAVKDGRGKEMKFVNTDQVRKVGKRTKSAAKRRYGHYADLLDEYEFRKEGKAVAEACLPKKEAQAEEVKSESVPTIDDLIALLKKKGAKSVRIEF